MIKVGDKVKVINRKCGHGFNIGKIVVITEVTGYNYECKSESGEYWKLHNTEFELIKPKTDPIVKSVIKQFKQRSKVGIKKYGTTLKDNNTDDFLQHLKEELMDGILYIQKLQEDGSDK